MLGACWGAKPSAPHSFGPCGSCRTTHQCLPIRSGAVASARRVDSKGVTTARETPERGLAVLEFGRQNAQTVCLPLKGSSQAPIALCNRGEASRPARHACKAIVVAGSTGMGKRVDAHLVPCSIFKQKLTCTGHPRFSFQGLQRELSVRLGRQVGTRGSGSSPSDTNRCTARLWRRTACNGKRG